VLLGGSAGILALVATAVTYVANTIYTAWSQSQNAQVLQLQYPGHQIVSNSGTMPLMLSHYEFRWHFQNKPMISAVVNIGKEIPPKEALSNQDDSKIFKDRLSPEAFVANAHGDGAVLLPYASPEFDKCYLMVFFSSNAPEVQYLNSFFAQSNVKLATAGVDEAFLFYYSVADPMQWLYWKKFNAVAAFWKLRDKKDCPETSAAERDQGRSQPKP
jgi:hypothetical protein